MDEILYYIAALIIVLTIVILYSKSSFAAQLCDYVNNSKPFPSGKLPGSEMY